MGRGREEGEGGEGGEGEGERGREGGREREKVHLVQLHTTN
jgi:hypothetical protein